ncbi:quaternary amine ABC transporter ATP-binding protein [Brevibacterium luteolum]|uniref:quaternary amine ABC transporter ATP-binding protein n=1 Tax=Brevibacterium luteolum TaxID=199591 RepID=UPI00223ACCC7|nr:glycine betaine/L-proline ABC transporter ATP-binding protein [Brevibacterium luteolum]MCT1872483.1 glycine betaine/L-proline ABC transporter ATP-binding protein [Brevibacterium luteolum]MCT1890223.1 glycine betaine/L-proline ABC transporter ATP-binding protein [Brevibacterium luteolum]MCT1892743.1 glycine betaine/L-proline ABC transporter ATP-binding protein [Brevibacterium luteolum]MCT1923400.1 glycine betaine/L-proline ABC transporter ATP-binding protein [Brevibacterium luteolum]
MAVVEASHVYKVFGKRGRDVVKRLKAGADREELSHLGTAAVIDASFTVERGESFVVMGLSGSGKSTLIRMINGLWSPTSGTVRVAGEDISQMSAAQLRRVRRDNIAMVFQHFALMPHRTVRENAAYALEIKEVAKTERLERADHWLDVVGLDGWGDKYPSQLSGGMQQRVGLARALASESDILLMDEAFSALDPLIRREMQEQLVELQSSLNKTIIFITHDLNEAMYLGDRIAVMRAGRIVQIGTAEEILTSPADDYVASFIQDVDRTRVLTAGSVMKTTDSVVPVTAGPRVAARTMEERNVSALFVTDRSRQLLGIVTDDDVVAAARTGTSDLSGLLRTEGLLSVSVDTPLSDLFAPSAEALAPLAVTDDKNRLVGIIPRIQLLNAMASATSDTSAASPPEALTGAGAAAAGGSSPASGSTAAAVIDDEQNQED